MSKFTSFSANDSRYLFDNCLLSFSILSSFLSLSISVSSELFFSTALLYLSRYFLIVRKFQSINFKHLKNRKLSLTRSSSALWCSNSDLSAFSTSASEETPWLLETCDCRFTTVILSDFSCLETKDSKCSSKSY